MSRIELRGVITPSEYDSGWMEKYIERGIITPESRFRLALSSADPSQPLEIYVNSPGGSVFAANEMINAVREWKATSKQPVTVTVGAMAASAAAVLAVMVADKIKAHSNAKMMFHGAYTLSLGGQGVHEDAAELLGKMNAEIKTRLISRYGMQPETVDQWFEEGRAGWLDVADMQASGIASEVIGDTSDAITIAKQDMDEIEGHGIGIAAFYDAEKKEDEDAGANADTDDGEDEESGDEVQPGDGAPAEGDGDGAGDPDTAETEPDEEPAEGTGDGTDEDEEEKNRAEIIAAVNAAVLEVRLDVAEQIDALQKAAKVAGEAMRQMQSERDKIRDEMAKATAAHMQTVENLTARLESANARVQRFLDTALAFSPAVESWEDALASCGGDYAEAAKRFPELRRKYEQENRRK